MTVCRAENGKIVLGPRGVLELKSYLLEEDLFKECAFCKNLITSGQVCDSFGLYYDGAWFVFR